MTKSNCPGCCGIGSHWLVCAVFNEKLRVCGRDMVSDTMLTGLDWTQFRPIGLMEPATGQICYHLRAASSPPPLYVVTCRGLMILTGPNAGKVFDLPTRGDGLAVYTPGPLDPFYAFTRDAIREAQTQAAVVGTKEQRVAVQTTAAASAAPTKPPVAEPVEPKMKTKNEEKKKMSDTKTAAKDTMTMAGRALKASGERQVAARTAKTLHKNLKKLLGKSYPKSPVADRAALLALPLLTHAAGSLLESTPEHNGLAKKLKYVSERAFEGISYEQAGELIELIVPFAEALLVNVETPAKADGGAGDL